MTKSVVSPSLSIDKLLTKKQIAQLAAFNDATDSVKLLMGLESKGQFGKACKALLIETEIEKLFLQFEKSGHSNVACFARYVSVKADAWLEDGKIPPCPTKQSDFFAYPDTIKSWAYAAKSDKVQSRRMDIYEDILALIERVRTVQSKAKKTKPTTKETPTTDTQSVAA